MSSQVVPANSVPFGELCLVLDQIAKKKQKPEKEKVLNKFIIDFKLNAAKIQEDKNSSFFPILRLLVPSLDRERGAYNLKESKLGALLVKVLSIKKDSNDGRKLLNFRSAGSSIEGDFASVAFFVLKSRMTTLKYKMTVGDVNDVLDKIAFMEAGNKGQMLDDLFSHAMRSLTAEHMKWFLRLVLKDLKLGMGVNRILCCFHPDAPEAYHACGNLAKVCEDLEDGNVVPLEMGVQMFFAISPMLSERLDVTDVASLPAGRTYQVEEKFDGERFQLHMNDGVFEYFSRKGHSYTANYGKTFESGLLTPLLKDCFGASVTSCILDGEMMGWDTMKQCFGSKGMAFDVKKITERSRFRPCFCAFDILYYNERSLVGPPEKGGLALKERLKILDKIFTEVPGAMQQSKRFLVQQTSDILNALNKSIDSQEEGIVLKDIDSFYIVNRRNAGWFKIKPEYTEGATVDLDLVIIGADAAENKRQGKARSFLVACFDSVGEGAPHRWLCVGRVATGLSHDERERVCAHLEQHWTPSQTSAPPPALVLNKIKPDFWIIPQNSIVLQECKGVLFCQEQNSTELESVRATELIRSTDFATSHTLRFPRVVKIREDKPIRDIMTLDEFDKLVGNKGSVIKMANKRIREDQIGGAPKIRKKRTTNVQVAADFKAVSHSDVEVTSNALSNRKLCVLSADEDCSREELIRIIETHGGTHVANYGPDTWCCVVGKLTYRARLAIDSQEADVISTAWLRSLPPSPVPCAITPLDLLSMRTETRVGFAREYDVYGDSYTEEVDVERLKIILERMDNDPPKHLTTQEMISLDKELFTDCSNPHSFLRGCAIRVADNNSLLAIQAQMYGAKILTTTCDDTPTHVVVKDCTVNSVDSTSVSTSVRSLSVTEQWLKKCILERRLVEETEFLV